MTLKVHLLNPPEAKILAVLMSQLVSRARFTSGPEIPSPAEYHVLVGGGPEQDHLTASPNLHTLIIPFAGIPSSTRQLMLEFPHLAVHNLHYNTAPTAEMALALMLAAAKFLVPFDRQLRQGDWSPRYQPNPSALLAGKTVLILGYGHIGRRVGQVCQALGMDVLGIRRQVVTQHDEAGVAVHPSEDLSTLLKRTHTLIVTLPGTPGTDGIIGERELALMPPGGMVVNVGRGLVVDQGALYQALQSGHLHAAGLDVWYNYPDSPDEREHTPPADYPFHELDNVVMSPHRGGGSESAEVMRMSHLAILLNAIARGDPVPNRVDLEAGY